MSIASCSFFTYENASRVEFLRKKAVEQEILASYEKLYRLAFSYVKNEQDAMDVVQESVYKAMKNASQIKEKKYIKTWLWRIVINTAVDATRRQSRFVSDDQVQEEGQEDRYEDTDIMATPILATTPSPVCSFWTISARISAMVCRE